MLLRAETLSDGMAVCPGGLTDMDVPTVEFEDGNGRVLMSADVSGGEQLLDVCDSYLAPVAFSCRAGRCGTCSVRVVAGQGILEKPGPTESALLSRLALPPDFRLSCQARLGHRPGTVRVSVGGQPSPCNAAVISAK